MAVASVVGCYCCSLLVWNLVYPDDENPASDVESPAWEGQDDSDVENQLVEFVPTRQLAACDQDDSDVENQLVGFVPTRQLAACDQNDSDVEINLLSSFHPVNSQLMAFSLAITSSVKISRMTITQSSSRDPKIESS